MLAKQNPSLDEDESAPARNEESTPEKSETPRSYYYDDSTGYEIYNEEIDTAEDAEDAEEPDEEGH